MCVGGGVAAMASLVPLRAQPARVARLCVLSGTARRFSPIDWLLRRLGERGRAEGRNLVVEFRTTESDTKGAEPIARERVRLKCDVILATSTAAALAMHARAPTTPLVLDIGGDDDIDKGHQDLLREPADALPVLHGTVTFDNASNISCMAKLGYGVSWPARLTDIAGYLARILDGANPAGLPVRQPTRFEQIVNLGLARSLGIRIPQPVLLQATEVIQ